MEGNKAATMKRIKGKIEEIMELELAYSNTYIVNFTGSGVSGIAVILPICRWSEA